AFRSAETLTDEIDTLSLHDALPISGCRRRRSTSASSSARFSGRSRDSGRNSGCVSSPRRLCRLAASSSASSRHHARFHPPSASRSEEHTSELQSRENLVCRLLLEKK